ncbi:DUF3343 domain-containing protein [Granulimonas faecalis]|uniref:Putative Se/S carrier protein-like domain-containing protein n=1 Tax=Granulimonas faecalis TaxID=2894155 RepID=A0AAV5B377_9ACTN|nr:DUF3343 domain-containing protein [Granulimonas faecalis]MBF0599366.1 DUF3343 domain-containing protein [Atopobiaceae bacterium FL090493]GJM54900.1 hypothetical protein ATOP_05550 [Granulimonas faecalis]
MGRRKRLRAVATFASTHDAVEAEALCKGAGIAGRLIPTPVAVRATCGLSWSMDPADRGAFEAVARGRFAIESIQELEL